MHKFYLGQPVAYWAPRRALRGFRRIRADIGKATGELLTFIEITHSEVVQSDKGL